ncbi:Uncharacterised protein [Citrobacter freundii]|nr:Uncharacterised protein [Citrobacter freundii]
MQVRFLSACRIFTSVCLLNLLLIPASQAAAESSVLESSTKEYAGMKKISARQLVVNVEKKGIFNVSVFFSGREDISWTPDVEETDKRRKIEQALFNSIHNDVNGRILIYDFDTRRLFHEIEIPPAGETRYQDGMYIIDKNEISEAIPNFEITKPGRYVIIPEIYSRSDELTDYTLFFERIYHTK